jgi:hypothetical protein
VSSAFGERVIVVELRDDVAGYLEPLRVFAKILAGDAGTPRCSWHEAPIRVCRITQGRLSIDWAMTHSRGSIAPESLFRRFRTPIEKI